MSTKPVALLQKAVTRLHIGLYRASGGRIGGKLVGLPVLLLTTTGRRSGKPRTTPLCYLADGNDLVVVASNGGAVRHPAWWLNLVQTPHATVETGRSKRAVKAREATAAEHERLWAVVTAIAPGYLKYQERTRRRIPLGILEPD